MKTQSIAAKTGMGAVDLAVTDGDTALRFYRDYVGLTPLPSDGNQIRMGAGGRELVVLHPDAERAVVPKTSGLYHLAIVLPDRRELARVIARLGRLRWDQYPTDHVMTKANYLWDPDGNGIEIYVESPEDGTMGMVNGTYGAWDKDGRPRSGRDPIDLEEMFSHRNRTTGSTSRCRPGRRWVTFTSTSPTSTRHFASTSTWSAST